MSFSFRNICDLFDSILRNFDFLRGAVSKGLGPKISDFDLHYEGRLSGWGRVVFEMNFMLI